jgi:cell wall-associated NlpC family hydrolase
MRRSILGLLVGILAVGLIGINFGQEAQARSTDKEVVKQVSAKKHAAAGKTAKKHPAGKKAVVKAKSKSKAKHSHANHSKKEKTSVAKHARKHGPRTDKSVTAEKFRQVATLPELPPQQASDLWLARDLPDTYREMIQENEDRERHSLTRKVLESAYSYLGRPYRYGGTTPHGFDCSGFVRYVFGENGIRLGRSSREQAMNGVPVPMSDLKPGDLIFFNMQRSSRCLIDHVGLYVGNGQFIHAASSHPREIKMESLESARYLPKVVETRRVLDNTEN